MPLATSFRSGDQIQSGDPNSLLRFLLEQAPCFIIELDLDYKIVSINKTVEELISQDVIGSDCRQFISAEHRGLFEQMHKKVCAKKKPQTFELAGVGPRDTVSWYQSVMGPILKDKKVVGVTLIATDVSPQETMQPDMRAKNQFIRGIQQNMPIVLYRLNKDGIYTESVGKGLGRLSMEDREVLGQKATDLYPGIQGYIQRALSGESVVFESSGTKDGMPWAYLEYLFFDSERGEGAIGFAIDITDRKQIEQALRANMEQLHTLVEHAQVCIHDIDTEGRLIAMNAAGLKMIEAENEEDVLGLDYLEFIAEEDLERIRPLFAKALSGKPSEFEFDAFVHGKRKRFSSSFIPVRDANGNVVRITGISHEITKRKRALDEVAALEETVHQQEWSIQRLQEENEQLRQQMANWTKKKMLTKKR